MFRKIKEIKKIFEKQYLEANIYKSWEHTGWGNAIRLSGFPKIDGHISNPYVKEGDEFVLKMESGELGHFRAVKVTNCNDPRDMFFAELKPIGHITEEELEFRVKELSKNKKVSWLL